MYNEPQEDIFHITARYVAEVQAGKQPNISDYISCYPQYADALADFAAYYQSFEADIPSPTSSAPLSQVSQVAFTRALEQVQTADSTTITTLLATGTRYLTLSELARKLDLSIDIMALLEQRVIDPATIPLELYRRIADILQQPIRVVQTYLARSPANADFANEARPPLKKVAEDPALYRSSEYSPEQGFRFLIEESLWLSPAQRATWLAILTQEGL